MGFDRQLETTPQKAAADLDALELPERAGEAEQMKEALAAAKKLVATVSQKERVLVSITGHSDPSSPGFDARHVSISISRVDPEAIRQREESARAMRESAAAHVKELREQADQLEESLPPAP